MFLIHPDGRLAAHRDYRSVTARLASVLVRGSTLIVLATTATAVEDEIVDDGTTEDTCDVGY